MKKQPYLPWVSFIIVLLLTALTWALPQVGRSHSSGRPSKHYHPHNLANTSSS